MTFKTILLSTIFSLSMFGCKSPKRSEKQTALKEFEGVITYREVTKSGDETINLDDTVQFFYSHGNYVNVHSEKLHQFHIVKDYYFENGPLRLMVFNNFDTLRQDLNFPIEKLDRLTVRKVNDKILSRRCEEITVNLSYNEKDSTTYTDASFVFSRGYLNIDKQHFKNWNLGGFNKVIDASGAYYLKLKSIHFDSSHKNILSTKTLDVISVKEGPIDPKIFEINTEKWSRTPN